MGYLSFVNNNLYLYLAIIIALLVLDIILTIICINQKKRRNIKKEFAEVESDNDSDSVLETSLEDEVKPEVAFELEQILAKMQQDIEMQPEEVVRKFEEEQEQKAIISYQELVESVNNNKIDVVDDEDGDMDYVAALESQLNNKEDYLETVDATNTSNDSITSDYANKSHLDVIDQMNIDDEPKRFKSSEILSPVFGRMQPDFEYHTIDSFANTNNKVEIEQVAGDDGVNDIKKNEDFLKALIEFRNNL